METLKAYNIYASESGLIGGTKETNYTLRYTGFIAPVIKAIQEQQQTIQQQQTIIDKQSVEIESLKQTLQEILNKLK